MSQGCLGGHQHFKAESAKEKGRLHAAKAVEEPGEPDKGTSPKEERVAQI